MTSRLRGALAPVLTPFGADLEPDTARFIAHCRWLLDQQASLAIFGTNSEAASLTVGERLRLTDALLAAGLPAARMMPGTGACALGDAVELARHASRAGVGGLLVLPPFYYKNVAEDGVYAYYAELIERVGSGCAPIYLYHIPQFSGVPITLSLIERLLARYPGQVVGVKDSSGNWDNTQAMLENYAGDGFEVFPASESLLSRALPLGAVGCISATVNMNPAGIVRVIQGWNTAEGAALQAQADAVRMAFQGPTMIASMKQALASYTDQPGWRHVRPPLVTLDDAAVAQLQTTLQGINFSLPGYPRVAG